MKNVKKCPTLLMKELLLSFISIVLKKNHLQIKLEKKVIKMPYVTRSRLKRFEQAIRRAMDERPPYDSDEESLPDIPDPELAEVEVWLLFFSCF